MIKRILLTALILATGSGLVFGVMSPWAQGFKLSLGAVPASSEISVKPQNLELVCPGGLLVSGGKSGAKLGAFATLDSALLSVAFDRSVGASLKIVELPVDEVGGQPGSNAGSNSGSDAVSAIPARVANPTAITVIDSSGQLPQGSKLLSANQLQRASLDNLAGLAGTVCQKPTAEQWLLGGSTLTGRESLLIMSNPSAVAAVVDLQLFSEAGALEGPGLAGISVSAGQTEIIQLASLSPKTTSFAVHLKARGGAIASWLQQKTQRGLGAEGVDYVGPSPVFDKNQIIPGLLVRGTKSAAKLVAANSDYADLAPTLRVFVPGDQDATFTAQIMSSDKKSFGTVIQQTVAAGRVAEFAIEDLADGDYVAFVTADQPIGAAIRLSRTAPTNSPITDFAWLPSAHQLSGDQVIATPSAGISKISFANADSGPAQLTLSWGSSTRTISLKTGASAVIETPPGAKVRISSDQKFAATMIVDVGGQVSALPLVDFKNFAQKVLVSVR